MSHRIIISKSSIDGASLRLADSVESDLEYSITYNPAHDLTPEQQAARVEQILRAMKRLEGRASADE